MQSEQLLDLRVEALRVHGRGCCSGKDPCYAFGSVDLWTDYTLGTLQFTP